MIPAAEEKKSRGCLFYAAVTAAALFLLIVSGVVMGYVTVRKAVGTWTATQPVALPQTVISHAEVSRIQGKVAAFSQSVKTGVPTQPLVLTAQEINGIISSSPDFEKLKGSVHIRIEDGRALADLSIPLGETGVKLLKGRYLNGTGTVKTRFEEGKLNLTFEEVQVKGKPLPRVLMTRIRNLNFAQKLDDDPESAAFMSKLRSIEITGDAVKLVPLGK